MARRYCVWWLQSKSTWGKPSGLQTGSLGPRTGLFLIIFGHSVHDSVSTTLMPLEWLEVHAWYYTLHGILNNSIVWKDPWWKYLTLTEDNDELISGFTLPSSSPTQISCQQQHRRTPWQGIQQFDISYLAVSTCMHEWWCIILLHVLSNHFKPQLCNNTIKRNNNQLISASDCTRVPMCRITSNNDTSQLHSNIFTNLTSWIIVIL